MKVTESIDKDKMQKFHETLCATGGRYLGNPIDCGSRYVVYYEPGDYFQHNEIYLRYTTPIKETRSDGMMKRLIRRIKFAFNVK